MTNRAVVGRVTDVQPHPVIAKLDVVSIGGFTNVADRETEDIPRYKIDDYAVMLVPHLILPTWLLQYLDLWNAEKGKGRLSGSKGNRTNSRTMEGVKSEIALLKIDCITMNEPFQRYPDFELHHMKIVIAGFATLYVRVAKRDTPPSTPDGLDVTEMLGIEPYLAPV